MIQMKSPRIDHSDELPKAHSRPSPPHTQAHSYPDSTAFRPKPLSPRVGGTQPTLALRRGSLALSQSDSPPGGNR